MTHTQIDALIFLALAAAAGGFAIHGWLWNIPNGVARFRARCLADGLFGAAMFWGGSTIQDSLWWRISNYIAGGFALMAAQGWWRKWELARRVAREYEQQMRRQQMWRLK